MLDCYEQGIIERISPEAPVPVVKIARRWSRLGGAGHVAASLAALGSVVSISGVVGNDSAGTDLLEALRLRDIDSRLVVPVEGLDTIRKTRILAGNSVQVLRIDEEPDSEAMTCAMNERVDLVLAQVPRVKFVILSDYDKGTLSPGLLRQLIRRARECGIPVVVDPKKKDFSSYFGASVITPNHLEAQTALGRCLTCDNDFNDAAVELRQRYCLESVVITRGADGMTGVDAAGVFSFPAHVRDVSDVTGAGDTVVAVLAHVLAEGGTVREGCELASVAAGIAVSRPGAYVVSAGELRSAMGGKSHKIVGQSELVPIIRQVQSAGKRVVFTNGCFDLLHAGHLHSLRESRRHGDLLVVGLNSDRSVKKLKGNSRPVNHERDRAELLAGLSCVDFVVVFEEETPEHLVRSLSPDVLAKGGDYQEDDIAGAAFVKSRGGKVVLIPLVPRLSSTRLIREVGL